VRKIPENWSALYVRKGVKNLITTISNNAGVDVLGNGLTAGRRSILPAYGTTLAKTNSLEDWSLQRKMDLDLVPRELFRGCSSRRRAGHPWPL